MLRQALVQVLLLESEHSSSNAFLHSESKSELHLHGFPMVLTRSEAILKKRAKPIQESGLGFFPCSYVKPPRGSTFSCAPERKRALVRSSLLLGPACQHRSSFRAVTGCRNPPELRDFTAELRSAFPRHDLCYPCSLH